MPARHEASQASQIYISPKLDLEELLNASKGEDANVAVRVEVQNDVYVRLRNVVSARYRAKQERMPHTLSLEAWAQLEQERKRHVACSVFGRV